MTNTTTTTATAHTAPAPAPILDALALTPAEVVTLGRWLRSKNGPIRSYVLKLRNRSTGDSFAPLAIAPGLDTAAWRPTITGARTHHNITLGERAPAVMPGRARTAKGRRQAAMRALLTHECAHAAHTARNFASTLIPLMRRANIPFSVFNLFEDARIEALAVAYLGKPFAWRQHLSPPPNATDNPVSYFYSLVYAEGEKNCATWTGAPDCGEFIRLQYRRTVDITQTADSAAALARALEFCQRFALAAIELPEHQRHTAPDGLPDPSTIPTPAPDADQVLQGGTPGAPAPAPDGGTHNAAPNSTGGTPAEIQTALLRDLPAVFLQFARRPGTIEPFLGDARRTASELAALAHRAAVAPARLGQSGHRIHAPAVAVGVEAAFRRTAPAPGPRRLCLIIDMSGSMSSTYRDHAAAFLAAALELHRTRALYVDAWLSQTGVAAKLPHSTRTESLLTLGANGSGEGLSNCMRQAAADMHQASACVVYTDGQLGSDTLPRRMKGQDIIGAVCAPGAASAADYQKQLRQHFDRALVATTPHQLAREIVRYVLTRPV